MSKENLEVVRRVYAEWERGNFRTPEFFDPSVHVTWVDPIFARRAETRGIEEAGESMREFLEALEDATATAERIIDAGDRVVTVHVWRGRGRSSGLAMESRQGSIWTISNGKATRVVNYSDPAKALEAAGLRE
jgi:ketosteroid isomerase-like protein